MEIDIYFTRGSWLKLYDTSDSYPTMCDFVTEIWTGVHISVKNHRAHYDVIVMCCHASTMYQYTRIEKIYFHILLQKVRPFCMKFA